MDIHIWSTNESGNSSSIYPLIFVYINAKMLCKVKSCWTEPCQLCSPSSYNNIDIKKCSLYDFYDVWNERRRKITYKSQAMLHIMPNLSGSTQDYSVLRLQVTLCFRLLYLIIYLSIFLTHSFRHVLHVGNDHTCNIS